MSLHHSQSPKPTTSEQTAQPGLTQESNQLAESAYITSDYQKASTNRDFGQETAETKFDASSPDRHFNSSRFSGDDKQPFSAYSTAGLTSNLGSAGMNYQYSSRDYTQPSTYGLSTYQPSTKIESSAPVTQSYSYSSYKKESTSPTIKALNENTASLLGRSAALDSNFGKTSLTLHGLAPENRTLSFGASNYSADLKNLGLGKEEYKTSFTTTENKEANPDLKYSDYLKPKQTTFEYGKSPYEATFGSTAIAGVGGIEGTSSSLYKNYSLRDEETRKSGLQANQDKGLYSSTDYTDLINRISNKETKTDNYTIIKPDSLTNTEKKQRPTHGSHYYQSTYPNTVRTPSESGKKDRYASSEISGMISPPFKRDKVEVERHPEVADDYVISDPHITKKTLYTIENAASISVNGGKDFVNQIALQRTPDRKIKSKSGSPSPFDDLKHALKNDSVQISKIVIETVENYGGEAETFEPVATTHHRHGSEKFDIVMEQHQRELQNKNHSRNASIKSPDNIKIQRNLVEESSSFKEPLYQHSRKHSDANSSRVGGTISAINERIQNLDHYLSQGTRSASKQSANLMTPNKAETSGVHHRVQQPLHHDEKSTQDLKEKQKQDEKEKARLEKLEKEKEKERAKADKEKEKERAKLEKEREKKEKEEAKLKAKQAAALAKEANKHLHGDRHLIVKFIIGFIILILLGVLSFELVMGAEEYDALLDTPLDKVLQ